MIFFFFFFWGGGGGAKSLIAIKRVWTSRKREEVKVRVVAFVSDWLTKKVFMKHMRSRR